MPDEYHIGIPAGLTVDLTAAIKGLKTLSSIQNALDAVVLKYQSEANQEYQRKEEQASRDGNPLATPPVLFHYGKPLSSSEAELAHIEQQQALLNRQLYPLQIINFAELALPSDWQGIKQALIDHIERAIPA